MTDCRLPIGVFDSGLGGLTVYRQLREILPGEDILYLGDTARIPYGSKSPATIINFSVQITRFLLDKQIKMLIVACNTASSLALDTLKSLCPVPVIGVVEAGVRSAAAASRSKRIAVIGTRATIDSGAYPRTMKALNGGTEVMGSACPLFVPLVEEGFSDHPAAALVARDYLNFLTDSDTDALILGCTHYPILESLIRDTIPAGIQIVNPSHAVAEEVRQLLTDTHCTNPQASGRSEFYVTDLAAKFHELSSRFLGYPLESVHTVSVETLESYGLHATKS